MISGLLMQFYFGILLMRVEFGYMLFKFFGDQINTFLNYANKGSELVFGTDYRDHFFAFTVSFIDVYVVNEEN